MVGLWPLLPAEIPRRQCSRAEYDGTDLSAEERGLLEDAGRGTGVSLMLLTDSQQKEQVAEYVAGGNTAQFGDPRWAEEMKSWIRFNGREAVATGDGLYGRALGIPAVPRWLGSPAPRDLRLQATIRDTFIGWSSRHILGGRGGSSGSARSAVTLDEARYAVAARLPRPSVRRQVPPACRSDAARTPPRDSMAAMLWCFVGAQAVSR